MSRGDNWFQDTTDRAYLHIQTTKLAEEVYTERLKQVEKWGPQTHRHSEGASDFWANKADEMKSVNAYYDRMGLDNSWEAILAEEFFEAMAETEWDKRRVELIQTAAVIFAEIEDGDHKEEAERAGYAMFVNGSYPVASSELRAATDGPMPLTGVSNPADFPPPGYSADGNT